MDWRFLFFAAVGLLGVLWLFDHGPRLGRRWRRAALLFFDRLAGGGGNVRFDHRRIAGARRRDVGR